MFYILKLYKHAYYVHVYKGSAEKWLFLNT